MSRLIKFRAWNQEDSRFEPDITKTFICINLEGGGRIVHPLLHVVMNMPNLPGWTIQQFTGLTDSEGKEIYEGDIVKWSESHWPEEERVEGIYEVKWNEDDLRLDFYDPFGNTWWPLCDTDFETVVGNICENPLFDPEEND